MKRKKELVNYKNREAAKDVKGGDSGVLKLSWLGIVEKQRLWISHGDSGGAIAVSSVRVV